MTEETTGWLAESKHTRRGFWTQLSLLKALRRTLCPCLPEGGGLEPRCQCSHYGLPQEGPPLDSRGQGLSGGLGPPMLGTAGHPCRARCSALSAHLQGLPPRALAHPAALSCR